MPPKPPKPPNPGDVQGGIPFVACGDFGQGVSVQRKDYPLVVPHRIIAETLAAISEWAECPVCLCGRWCRQCHPNGALCQADPEPPAKTLDKSI